MLAFVSICNVSAQRDDFAALSERNHQLAVGLNLARHAAASESDDCRRFRWLRYCARLQLALLQNVEDNLVREQAQFDLARASVAAGRQ